MCELLRKHASELAHFTRANNFEIRESDDVRTAATEPGCGVRSAEACLVSVRLAGVVNTKAELQKVNKRIQGALSPRPAYLI